MYCPKCGNQCRDDDVFCKKCGARLNSETSSSSSPSPSAYNKPSGSSQSGGFYSNTTYSGTPSYFNLPRVIALIGVLMYAGCEFFPIFSYYTDTGYIYDITMTGLSFLCLAIPVLMAYNALFDRGFVVGVSASGLHGGFLKFKLCTLFGMVGMCALLVIPSTVMKAKLGEGTVVFHECYYIAWVGAFLTAVAPFLVREKDRTGIQPVKAYDFIWILAAAAVTVFMIFRVMDMVNVFKDPDNIPDIYLYMGEYSSSTDRSGNTAGTAAETSAEESADNPLDKAIADWLKIYPDVNGYCMYDINSDGHDDIIFWDEINPNDSGDTYNAYDILLCDTSFDNVTYNYFDTVNSTDGIYSASGAGVYIKKDISSSEYGYFYCSYDYFEGLTTNEDIYSENNLTYTESSVYGEPTYNTFGQVVQYDDTAFSAALQTMEENRLYFGAW